MTTPCGGRSRGENERFGQGQFVRDSVYLVKEFDFSSESCEKPLMGYKHRSDRTKFSL